MSKIVTPPSAPIAFRNYMRSIRYANRRTTLPRARRLKPTGLMARLLAAVGL